MNVPGQFPPTLALAPVTSVLIWAAVLIVAVVVAGGGLLAYRRRMFAQDSGDTGSLLDSLRAMRDRGQISPAEFDAARKRMAARVAGVPPPPSAGVSSPAPDPRVRIAKPGFDLAGAPLPDPAPPGPDKRPDKPDGSTGRNPPPAADS